MLNQRFFLKSGKIFATQSYAAAKLRVRWLYLLGNYKKTDFRRKKFHQNISKQTVKMSSVKLVLLKFVLSKTQTELFVITKIIHYLVKDTILTFN